MFIENAGVVHQDGQVALPQVKPWKNCGQLAKMWISSKIDPDRDKAIFAVPNIQ